MPKSIIMVLQSLLTHVLLYVPVVSDDGGFLISPPGGGKNNIGRKAYDETGSKIKKQRKKAKPRKEKKETV